MGGKKRLRHPEVRVGALRSPNPLALVAAVRQELRRAGIHPDEIEVFTREALEHGDLERARQTCAQWVDVEALGRDRA
jgi:hypothetical protein